MAVREFRVTNWDKGLHTRFEDFSIPEEAASDSLNWLTLGDRIELSGGYDVIGTENGAGKITGLAVGILVDGTTRPIRTRGKKIEYYDNTTEDWVECGSDALGTDADGEDVSIQFYTSLAGYQAWLSSPNSGLFKMMLANPTGVEDNYDAAKNGKGYLLSQNGRLHQWYRLNAKNYLFGSYKDVQTVGTNYTEVSSEAIGSAPGPSYSGTLAFKGSTLRTCFGVVITDGTKTLTDAKDGTFTGDGTGTINYTTGAYSVTFNGATVAPVTADYNWEDSTSKGLADFTYSATRLATEGFFLPQPTGGDLLSVGAYRTEFFCLHELNTWLFSMPVDDLSPTNQVFREKVGLPSWRGAKATGDGIFYIDTSNPSDPKFKFLALTQGNDQVEPQEFAYQVKLSGYDFSDLVTYEWGDYLLYACKASGASVNNRMFAYHKKYRTIDLLNYQASVMADRDGDLWAGDSSTDNVTQLFTGFTANGSNVENYWVGKLSQHSVDRLKKFKRLTVIGEIGPSQDIEVDISYDNGGWQSLGTIDGSGSYVDYTPTGTVGAEMVGSVEVGGGGTGAQGGRYTREFRVRSGKYDRAKLRFRATGVGYASVSEVEFYDIRDHGQKNLNRFRTT